MQPYPFLNQHEPDETFDPVAHLDKSIDGSYGQARVAAQYKGDHHADTPDKNAVEKKGNNRFAAGAQRKVGGVQKGVLWHKNSR